ncbi:hypothetical protein [Mycobacterium sp. SMC-11]|uniref:hypothetical protein n=1 Tax=Mycobacterium sp. SMC-11 TaxID=3385969 RepID=UPI00390CD465
MAIFRKLRTKFGEHKRRVAGTLAFTGLAVAVFVAGAWAGSSGALTLGTTPTAASHAMHSPAPHGHDSDGSPMPAGEMGPNMKKHGEMGPNMKKHGEMPPGEMGPNKKPMKPGMPMHKSDKKCCDKA